MENISAGTILDGKFHVVAKLGEGGLGTVFRAEQPELNRTVAIKVMHHVLGEKDENLLRFEREARVLSTISHEHVVQVLAFGVLPGGFLYMVMEYLEGSDLSRVIAASGRLEWRRVCRIGIQICQALQAAHKQGVVHRDLKPHNIMLVDRPEPDTVKILDFGLSKLIDDEKKEHQKLTQTGALVGSVHYMSPEMCSGQQADIRSDIYSVGCVLYECLAGVPVFESDNPVFLLYKHQTELPKAFPRDAGTEAIPDELERVVFKCLQKRREDRYQSTDELEAALKLASEDRLSEIACQGVQMGGGSVHPGRSITITILLIVISFAAAGGFCVYLAKMLNEERQAKSMGTIMGEKDLENLTPDRLRLLGRRLKSKNNTASVDERCSAYLAAVNSLPAAQRDPSAGVEAGPYAESTIRLADRVCWDKGADAAAAMVDECLSWVQKYKPKATAELCSLLEWKADYLFWLKNSPESESIYRIIGREALASYDLEESRKRRFSYVSGLGLARCATIRGDFKNARDLIEKVYQRCAAAPRMQASALVELIGASGSLKDEKTQKKAVNEILQLLRQGWLWREPRPLMLSRYYLWNGDIFDRYGDKRLAAEFFQKAEQHCRREDPYLLEVKKRTEKLAAGIKEFIPEGGADTGSLNQARSQFEKKNFKNALEAVDRFIVSADALLLNYKELGDGWILKADILKAQKKDSDARKAATRARQAYELALIPADDASEWDSIVRRLGDVESRYMGIPFEVRRSKKLPNRLVDGWIQDL